MLVRHVDDRIRIVTTDKITEYMKAVFQQSFVMKTTNWKKVLGWDAVINKDERTVTFECPGVLLAAGEKYLKDTTFASNKHIMLPSLMDLQPGVAPPANDPDYQAFVNMQMQCRSLQGLAIWLCEMYTQGLFVTRITGKHVANPSWDTFRHLKFMLMHLIAHPYAPHYGGPECRSIEQATPIKQPVSFEDKLYHLYYMCDAGLAATGTMTSVVGMLAAAQIDSVCQRQHNKAGESHTAEIVAGGTALHRIIRAREVMREWHCGPQRGTSLLIDSATTIYVATDDTAVKRSMWLARRASVMQEGVEAEEIEPIKISEDLNAADMHTKYLTYPVWKRHVWHVHNLTKERCDAACKRMAATRTKVEAKSKETPSPTTSGEVAPSQ
jgi:hypothetical protein